MGPRPKFIAGHQFMVNAQSERLFGGDEFGAQE